MALKFQSLKTHISVQIIKKWTRVNYWIIITLYSWLRIDWYRINGRWLLNNDQIIIIRIWTGVCRNHCLIISCISGTFVRIIIRIRCWNIWRSVTLKYTVIKERSNKESRQNKNYLVQMVDLKYSEWMKQLFLYHRSLYLHAEQPRHHEYYANPNWTVQIALKIIK